MTTAPTSTVMRRLGTLALPILGNSLLHVATLTVDTILCGHIPDQGRALTALGFAVQLVFLFEVSIVGLTVGVVALIARANGSGDTARANHILAQANQLTLVIGGALAVLGFALARPLLAALGASPEIATLGAAYMRPIMIGLPILFLTETLEAALRAVRHSRLPFQCGLITNACNVVLTFALIGGHFGLPALGIAGAAIGTTVSRGLGLLLLASFVTRGVIPPLVMRLRPVGLDRPLWGQLLRIGAPAIMERLIFFGSVVGLVYLLARVDELAVAAHGVGSRIFAIVLIPGIALSMATAAMVGNALGADDVAEARRVTRATLVSSIAIMTGLAVLLHLNRYNLMAIFDVDPASTQGGFMADWLLIIALSLIPNAVAGAYSGLLRGAGATRTSLRIQLASILAIQIPIAVVLGTWTPLGAIGIWASYPLSTAFKGLLGWLAYRRSRWIRAVG